MVGNIHSVTTLLLLICVLSLYCEKHFDEDRSFSSLTYAKYGVKGAKRSRGSGNEQTLLSARLQTSTLQKPKGASANGIRKVQSKHQQNHPRKTLNKSRKKKKKANKYQYHKKNKTVEKRKKELLKSKLMYSKRRGKAIKTHHGNVLDFHNFETSLKNKIKAGFIVTKALALKRDLYNGIGIVRLVNRRMAKLLRGVAISLDVFIMNVVSYFHPSRLASLDGAETFGKYDTLRQKFNCMFIDDPDYCGNYYDYDVPESKQKPSPKLHPKVQIPCLDNLHESCSYYYDSESPSYPDDSPIYNDPSHTVPPAPQSHTLAVPKRTTPEPCQDGQCPKDYSINPLPCLDDPNIPCSFDFSSKSPLNPENQPNASDNPKIINNTPSTESPCIDTFDHPCPHDYPDNYDFKNISQTKSPDPPRLTHTTPVVPKRTTPEPCSDNPDHPCPHDNASEELKYPEHYDFKNISQTKSPDPPRRTPTTPVVPKRTTPEPCSDNPDHPCPYDNASEQPEYPDNSILKIFLRLSHQILRVVLIQLLLYPSVLLPNLAQTILIILVHTTMAANHRHFLVIYKVHKIPTIFIKPLIPPKLYNESMIFVHSLSRRF